MPAPLLHLEKFRELMQIHPLHFWQLAGSDENTRQNGACDCVVREYAWQWSDGVGRDEIRQSLIQAENKLRDYLNYSVSPRWTSETIYMPSFLNPNIPQLTSLKEGKLLQIGTVSWQLIANYTLTFDDIDGDGINEKISFSFTLPSGVLVTDLAVTFLEADRVFNPSDLQRWQVPMTLTQSGTTITAVGKAWTVVKPVLYEGFRVGDDSKSPTDSANFVTQLSVYKRVVTGENDATLTMVNCDTSSSYTVCALIVDGETGVIQVKPQNGTDYNSSCDCGCYGWGSHHLYDHLCRAPLKLDINYRAGATIREWEYFVSALGAAELNRRVCGCDDQQRSILRWQEELALAEASRGMDLGERFNYPFGKLDNPFGTRRGQVYAWEQVRTKALLRAVRI